MNSSRKSAEKEKMSSEKVASRMEKEACGWVSFQHPKNSSRKSAEKEKMSSEKSGISL
jgi:hypothetical protein